MIEWERVLLAKLFSKSNSVFLMNINDCWCCFNKVIRAENWNVLLHMGDTYTRMCTGCFIFIIYLSNWFTECYIFILLFCFTSDHQTFQSILRSDDMALCVSIKTWSSRPLLRAAYEAILLHPSSIFESSRELNLVPCGSWVVCRIR